MLILRTNLAKAISRLWPQVIFSCSNLGPLGNAQKIIKISIFDLFAEGVLFSATFDQILLIESICLRRVAALA